jgi:sporulation protein YlmC with PRC-barrel domain
MPGGKVRFELLLGKKVRDPEGVRVGRILSVTAEIEGETCVVREYHLGTAALLARLGISPFGRQPLRVPWDLMDLSDPEHPRLRCLKAELKS